MIHDFKPGDFLIFQLESGFGLLRVLAVDETPDEPVWHLTVYSDLFLDAETADAASDGHASLSIAISHVALTNRAFESTQVARVGNKALSETEAKALDDWRAETGDLSDRSVRLLLGLR